MNRILVLDQASQLVGATIVDVSSGKPKWIMANVIKLKGRDLISRTAQLYDWVMDIVKEYKIDSLVLEEVSLGRKTNIKTTAALLKVLGIMELAGVKNELTVDILNVNHWKSLAGIRVRSREEQKSESIALAMRRWPNYADLIMGSNDIADALNMSLAYLIDKKFIKK